MKAHMKVTGAIFGLLFLALAGCARQETLPRSVMEAYEQAFNKNDIAACLALFTDDAQILPERGPIVSGHAAIERYLKDQMTPIALYDTDDDMTLVRRDVAVEQGLYRVRNLKRGVDIEEGKYIRIWRNTNGAWKLYRLIYNTDLEPRADVSVAEENSGQ